jgi:hypothetical protein
MSMSRKWVTIELVAHVGIRRVGALLPLRVEPGRKFLPGTKTTVRGSEFTVIGSGYEAGLPVVHLKKVIARRAA